MQLFHLATRLARTEDIKLLVVLLNSGQLEEHLTQQGVEVCVLDESLLSSVLIFKQFNNIVKGFRPDIIHTHRAKENVIGGLTAKLHGCKSVRTVHGASEFDANLIQFRRFIFKQLDIFAGRLFQQKIIVVSDELKQKLSVSFSQAKLTIINNCVDINYIDTKASEPSNIHVDDNKFNVAFVGRFVPVKRVDIFYNIAKATVIANPASDCVFHMIGDGPLYEDIAQRIAEDALGERIKQYGFVANTAPLLKQMDLLLFTSDHEGLPMTLLEAMALGVPVLSRNLPSMRSVLCRGECGFILESDDIKDYVAVIASLADDDAVARERAAKAAEEVKTTYNIENNVKEYLKLYGEIIAPREISR